MSEAELQQLLDSGRIERVEPDVETAREEIATALRHIEAVLRIVDLDPTLAFTGLYDAMRKAIQAHMRAHGYRVAKGQGGHVKTGAYARAALDTLEIGVHLDEFDTLRQLRNQSEYEALFVAPDEIEDALLHARAIVEAVSRALNP